MSQSIKELYGEKLGASDGEIGHVKDFYFDDKKWAVRYVVADTGNWLGERLVLLSPQAFGRLDQDGKVLAVNLTRQQIEKSPSIESNKPVSRQYEEEYFQYYGWPSYWAGSPTSGMNSIPPGMVAVPVPLPHEEPRVEDESEHDAPIDSHLQSMRSLDGYHIQSSDGPIGHVNDFLMDDKSWEIRHLVVKTGVWFLGKEVLISPDNVERISYEQSKVFVNLTKEAISQKPEYQPNS